MNSKESSSPKISVLMPAYNAEKYIGEAIESILNQTYKEFELILIDDCSKDTTWKIIQKYAKKDKRIIPVRNTTNLKLSKTLNKGLTIAKGEYIARMDADDLSYPDRLGRQLSFMEKNPDVGIVGGVMEIIDEKGNYIGIRKYPLDDESIRKKIFFYSPFSHPLIMIRKSVLKKSKDYNTDFNPAEDYELYFRIGKFSKFANLPDLLLKYRIVSKSMTTGNTKNMELMTIKIRNIYKNENEYKIGMGEEVYNLLHYLSLYIIPSGFKIKLFNLLRNG